MVAVNQKRKFAIEAPKGWYSNWEVEANSIDDFVGSVSRLSVLNKDRSLVWRGVSDANLALTSSLFRHLSKEISDGEYIFPSEKQMQTQEARILKTAYTDWRIKVDDPHSLMAQLQHLGAPTRFIDVTKNPYVALWFACNSDWGDDKDGRVFVFGAKNDDDWHLSPEASENNGLSWVGHGGKDGWGSNSELNVWFPPIGTHLRVFAQNAGFVFGGLPFFNAGSNSSYLKSSSNKSEKRNYWNAVEVKAATNLHFNPTSFQRKSRADAQKTPCWTIRIPARSKKKIRDQLQKSYGVTKSMLFPGLEGLAEALVESKN